MGLSVWDYLTASQGTQTGSLALLKPLSLRLLGFRCRCTENTGAGSGPMQLREGQGCLSPLCPLLYLFTAYTLNDWRNKSHREQDDTCLVIIVHGLCFVLDILGAISPFENPVKVVQSSEKQHTFMHLHTTSQHVLWSLRPIHITQVRIYDSSVTSVLLILLYVTWKHTISAYQYRERRLIMEPKNCCDDQCLGPPVRWLLFESSARCQSVESFPGQHSGQVGL